MAVVVILWRKARENKTRKKRGLTEQQISRLSTSRSAGAPERRSAAIPLEIHPNCPCVGVEKPLCVENQNAIVNVARTKHEARPGVTQSTPANWPILRDKSHSVLPDGWRADGRRRTATPESFATVHKVITSITMISFDLVRSFGNCAPLSSASRTHLHVLN